MKVAKSLWDGLLAIAVYNDSFTMSKIYINFFHMLQFDTYVPYLPYRN